MPTTEAQKLANKKWREANRDKYNARQSKYAVAYYYRNQSVEKQKSIQKYYDKKLNDFEYVWKQFRKIYI